MDTITTALVIILLTIILKLIYDGWKINQFWKERGVPHIKPLLFIGNIQRTLFRKISQGELYQELFAKFPNEPLIGIYNLTNPQLLIKDVDLIETILIKDFAYFTDHPVPLDEIGNPLDTNLFSLRGKRWKAMRSKLSPVFTTGKLKFMYETMADCGNGLINVMDNSPKCDTELEDIIGKFLLDTVGSCVFGLNAGNLYNNDSEFHRMAKRALQFDILTFIKLMIAVFLPTIGKMFKLTFRPPNVLQYFAAIVKNTLKYRRDNNVKRNDFVQMLLQIQDKGYVEMHSKDPADDYLAIDKTTYSTEKFELTDEQLTGHAVAFLTIGFDITTISLMYVLYELSIHPEIQDKVRQEVTREINKSEKMELTFDSLKEMSYLEQCVKETLRKYSPGHMLSRICNKEYTLPNGLTIPPGTEIIIPVTVVHNDPKYYPEPELFKPDRFDPEQSTLPPSCAYIAFGNGPRICIAMRFAMLQMKYCLAKVLLNYKVTLSPKTKQPLTIDSTSFFTKPKEKLYFNINKI